MERGCRGKGSSRHYCQGTILANTRMRQRNQKGAGGGGQAQGLVQKAVQQAWIMEGAQGAGRP